MTIPTRTLPALALCVALSPACEGDTSSADDDDSSSTSSASADTQTVGPDTSSSTIDPTQVDSSSEDGSTTTEGGSSSESTTGEPMGGDVRVWYELDSDDDVQRFDVVDLVDGSLQDPITVLDVGGVDHLIHDMSERWVVLARTMPQSEITAIDRSTPPPFTTHALTDAFTDADTVMVVATDDARVVLRTTTADATDLHVVELGDDGPGPAFQVDAGVPETVGPGAGVFVGDTRFAFRDNDAPQLWIAPLAADGPPPAVLAEASAPDLGLDTPLVDPTAQYLVYTEGAMPFDRRAFVVDPDDEPLEAPVPVQMLVDDATIRHIRLAPDGSGFAATHVDGELQDAIWVAVEAGTPAPAVQLTTDSLAGLVLGIEGWSPDGRWLAVHVDDVGAPNLYLAVRDGDGFGELVPAVSGGGMTGTEVSYTPDASAAFIAATVDGVTGVYRIALDGALPGEPELVSPELTYVFQHGVPPDAQALYVVGVAPGGDLMHLWWIDLSADEPSPPVQLDGDGNLGDDLFVSDITPTGSHLVYRPQLPDSSRAGVLVDTLTGAEHMLADGAPLGAMRLLLP